MNNRKRIVLITSNPESLYQQRVMEGVFNQCNKYEYDVVVLSTLVHINHFYKDYLAGELAIYDMIDFDSFDGIIITPLTLSDNNRTNVCENLLKKMKANCHCKVVSLDMEFGDYEVCHTDDRGAFYFVTKHVCEVHGCQKVYFLAGYEGNSSTIERLAGFLDYMKDEGRPVLDSQIFYGDFWYSSGEKLADQIAEGTVPMPEAVICASDHMAIGLTNRLTEHGISVPDQIIVTGYDATQDAVSNSISITSFIPPIVQCAINAVNVIHSCISPDEKEQPVFQPSADGFICVGESCGCSADVSYMKQTLNTFVYGQMHNYDTLDKKNEYDITLLLDSYMYESMIRPTTMSEFSEQVHKFSHLINPYNEFYFVLFEDWMKKKKRNIKSDPMFLAIHTSSELDKRTGAMKVSQDRKHEAFVGSEAITKLHTDRTKPNVFYVSTIHFEDEVLGFSIMTADLTQKHKIDYIYRYWQRNVTNAFEVMRIKMRLSSLSFLDSATGLYNRRGMYSQIEELMAETELSTILVIMADMDGLKFINDHYGHSEGDFAILSLAQALNDVVDNELEFCVRNGGDEFLFIGAGAYTNEQINDKIKRMEKKLESIKRESGKPYDISASFGYCFEKVRSGSDIDLMIGIADKRMYQQKEEKHRNRE